MWGNILSPTRKAQSLYTRSSKCAFAVLGKTTAHQTWPTQAHMPIPVLPEIHYLGFQNCDPRLTDADDDCASGVRLPSAAPHNKRCLPTLTPELAECRERQLLASWSAWARLGASLHPTQNDGAPTRWSLRCFAFERPIAAATAAAASPERTSTFSMGDRAGDSRPARRAFAAGLGVANGLDVGSAPTERFDPDDRTPTPTELSRAVDCLAGLQKESSQGAVVAEAEAEPSNPSPAFASPGSSSSEGAKSLVSSSAGSSGASESAKSFSTSELLSQISPMTGPVMAGAFAAKWQPTSLYIVAGRSPKKEKHGQPCALILPSWGAMSDAFVAEKLSKMAQASSTKKRFGKGACGVHFLSV